MAAYFKSYSPFADPVSRFEQLVEIDEEPAKVQIVPEATENHQKNKVFRRTSSSSRQKTLVICAVTSGIFALSSFIALCYLILKFHNNNGLTTDDGGTKLITENEYSGLDGRSCRIVNVENPDLVVNVHEGAMHDGSLAILWDKSELNWNSKWRAKSTRGGVRFEVISESGVLKVLAENVETNAVILFELEKITENNYTCDTPPLPLSDQVWILMKQPSGSLKIKNQKSGRYLKSNGKPNQLTTMTESESGSMEDKSCEWDIHIIDMIWNKEKNCQRF